MNTPAIRSCLLLILCAIPALCFAGDGHNDNVGTEVMLIALSEFILLVTSIVSIYQLFWKDNYNRTSFQIFNLIFATLFYTVSLYFLVHHKSYWDGFESLSDAECIKRVLLSTEPFALIKKIIWVAVILNIIYIIRWGSQYDLAVPEK